MADFTYTHRFHAFRCGAGASGVSYSIAPYFSLGQHATTTYWKDASENYYTCVAYNASDPYSYNPASSGVTDANGELTLVATFSTGACNASYPLVRYTYFVANWIRTGGESYGLYDGAGGWDTYYESGGKLQGTITDCATALAISGATVKIYNDADVLIDTLTTNESGYYLSGCLDRDYYYIVVSATGYTEKTSLASEVWWGLAVLGGEGVDTKNLCLDAAPAARKSDMKRHPITGAKAHVYNDSGTIKLQWFEPGSLTPDYSINVLTGQGTKSPSIEWEDDGRLRLCLSDGTTRKESATPWVAASWGNWT